MNEIILTDEQKTIVDQINKSKSKRILLIGKPGTGKSTILKHIKNCFYTATTNKAVTVLKEITNQENPCTIHSLIGMERKFDNKGEVYYQPKKYSNSKITSDNQIIVIDETSMIDKELLKLIERLPNKIIFSGDSNQLNPINETISEVFNKGYETYELKTIIRQKENSPIIYYSNNLNELVKKENKFHNDSGVVFTKNYQKIIDSIIKDDIIYLAWRNAVVNKVNKDVRAKKFNTNEQFVLGEKIIFNAPYRKHYFNNQIIFAERISNTKIYDLDSYSINGEIHVVKHHDMMKYQNIKQQKWNEYKHEKSLNNTKKANLLYGQYVDFIDTFADINYGYASSVHSSQGSTYKDVIIDINDIISNPNKLERKRLMYTALTRAKNLAIIYYQ